MKITEEMKAENDMPEEIFLVKTSQGYLLAYTNEQTKDHPRTRYKICKEGSDAE